MKKQTQAQYNNQSITSLKGADRVRKRPAVIFGSDGLEGCEHSVFEILSNAMDEVDGLFAELKIYASQRENPHFSATCRRLSALAEAIAESHRLSWWNLL